MIDYTAYAHTLFQVLFTNTHIKPCVRLQHLIKLAHILDEHIPPEDKAPLQYLPVIEDVLPRELSALSPDQLKVAINLLSVSRNPPKPAERPPEPIVQLCKLLVAKGLVTPDEINDTMGGTEAAITIAASILPDGDE